MKVFNISVKVISSLIATLLVTFIVYSAALIRRENDTDPAYSIFLYILNHIVFYAISYLAMSILLSVKKNNVIKGLVFTIINIIPLISLIVIFHFELFVFWMWFVPLLILPLVIFISSLFFKKSAKNTLSTNE